MPRTSAWTRWKLGSPSMAIVMCIFAAGLLFAAWRSSGGMRTTLLLIAALNLVCAVKMLGDGYEYAARLQPHSTPPGIEEPSHP